jgi:elongation factor 2
LGRKEENVKRAFAVTHNLANIRNFGFVAHIDHGKTTLSDNLLAGVGIISEELAGKQLLLDYDEQERARGITIIAAAASMVHKYKGEEYLINLIDTPGHVDFSGDVTRAMRAVDGALVLVCAVEGVMPQTETVLRQAIKERAKPVLFINKVDRLINELKLTPDEMQQRFIGIINGVNKLIKKMVPKEFEKDWLVRVDDGSVAFGSAYYNWAISIPWMKNSGITFKDIYKYCTKREHRLLAKRAPIHQILLDMVIQHLPNPLVAQKYRIPIIWRGNLESEEGKSMVECDPSGELALMVTKILIDPHAGDVVFGRIYSGSVTVGKELRISGMPYKSRVQQVSLMVGPERIPVNEVRAGNVVALTGLSGAVAGSTVTSSKSMEPFEKIIHYSDPVVTVAIEPKHATDLPKLVNVLRSIGKADPSIEVTINQETGEYLMSGMGELHLEITSYRIREEQSIPMNVSPPIVVYRETVLGKSPYSFEGKSPNRHNSFYLEVEPLSLEIVKALREEKVPSKVKKYKKEVIKQLTELGMEREEAKGVFACYKTNLFVDATKGIQHLFETKELLKEAFEEVMKKGPRARESLQGVKVRLVDAKLHEDAIHRGPAQVIPAIRNAIYGAMTTAKNVLLEPIQKVVVSAPRDLVGQVTKEILQRRGTIAGMHQEGDLTTIEARAPVAEMLGFSSAIRSATSGRVLWSTENMGFELLPHELQDKITREIRKRKGLKPEPYPSDYYAK